MRSLDLFRTLMTDVRSIIGSTGRKHLLACTSYQKTDEPVPGFTGSE
jgi:hypothetical protein